MWFAILDLITRCFRCAGNAVETLADLIDAPRTQIDPGPESRSCASTIRPGALLDPVAVCRGQCCVPPDLRENGKPWFRSQGGLVPD